MLSADIADVDAFIAEIRKFLGETA